MQITALENPVVSRPVATGGPVAPLQRGRTAIPSAEAETGYGHAVPPDRPGRGVTVSPDTRRIES